MTEKTSLALVGARGHVGRELIELLSVDDRFGLTMATSREHAGKSVADVVEAGPRSVRFEEAGPDEVAARGCEVVVLGLPNGLAAPYVEAIERDAPGTTVIDVSADYRHAAGWTYGLSDLQADDIVGATRIANPGCYATAGLLALYPLREMMAGTPSVFGVSGFSGAGTTPSPRNDPARLEGNIMPYGFSGHGHQTEMGKAIGRPVRFMPHVAQFFRGLICTSTVPLREGVTLEDIRAAYADAYRGSRTVTVTDELPEIRQVAGTPKAIVGGMAVDPETNVLSVACVHDNLLKGAASQALDNLHIALR